jgi:hypothetical protein
MSTANPRAYHTARNLAVLPNILDALRTWQAQNPDEDPIVGEDCAWGNSLGQDNLRITEALRSDDSIRNSFLWDVAPDACRGSKKVVHVHEQIRVLSSEETVIKHPDPAHVGQGQVLRHKSKYVLFSNLRLARALLWCTVVQTFGERTTVLILDRDDRMEKVDAWKKTWDKDNKEVDDECSVMVAALKVMCQSVNLTEGHVLEFLEPHPINAEAVQGANRQYRIGQEDPKVVVRTLIHKGSVVETAIAARNAAKNRFASDVKRQVVQEGNNRMDVEEQEV